MGFYLWIIFVVMKERGVIFSFGSRRSFFAALLLAILMWLGGSLVCHTLSDHHIHHHLAVSDDLAGETELCMLSVFSHTPLEEAMATELPTQASRECLLCTPTLVAIYIADAASPSSLRAPPFIFA